MKGYDVRHAVEEGFMEACNYANCMRIIVDQFGGPNFLVHHRGLEQVTKSAEYSYKKKIDRLLRKGLLYECP
jgi:hypothetical protein